MRRRSEFKTRDPPKIRSSSIRDSNGVRSNVEIKDAIRAKRVKFLDPESDCEPNIRPNDPAALNELTQDPASDGPKTSEYAYFKKLKKDAGCSRSFVTSKKEQNQSENFETSSCSRGISEKFKSIRENSKSTFLAEKVRPITRNLFLSPLANASTNAEAAYIVNKDSDKDMRFPRLAEKVKPTNHSCLFSPLGGASKTAGTESLDGVFSEKRKRLRQWVANTSLPKVGKTCSEGGDLVSVLIDRLFPDTVENNSCRDENPMQMRADTKFSSHAFPKLDKGDKGCHWTRRRDLLETEYAWYLEDVCNRSVEIVPSKWDTKDSDSPLTSHASRSHFQFENKKFSADYEGVNRSVEIVPSKWDTKDSDSPLISHASRNHFQFENKKFSADYEGVTPSLITMRDLFENYELAAPQHIKGLNNFQGMDESVNGRGPSTLLLGWDFDSFEDQGVLSIANRNAEMNSTMAASWDDHQQMLHNSSVASELDTSSFFFSYSSQFTSLPHPHSAPFTNGNEEKFLLAELKHFPLSLPCNPTYHNLLKDCDTYNTCAVSSTFSPQNHHWVINKVFSEKHQRDMEAFLHPSGLGFDLGCTHLSISGSISELYPPSLEDRQSPSKESECSYLLTEEQHEDCFYSSNHSQNILDFSEDTLHNHERFSANFWTPIDKEMSTPVLLHSSRWLRTEEEIYYDDDDGMYI